MVATDCPIPVVYAREYVRLGMLALSGSAHHEAALCDPIYIGTSNRVSPVSPYVSFRVLLLTENLE